MTSRAERRSWMLYAACLVVILYAIISVCIGVATADQCGDLDAPKEWRLAPPGWECVG